MARESNTQGWPGGVCSALGGLEGWIQNTRTLAILEGTTDFKFPELGIQLRAILNLQNMKFWSE